MQSSSQETNHNSTSDVGTHHRPLRTSLLSTNLTPSWKLPFKASCLIFFVALKVCVVFRPIYLKSIGSILPMYRSCFLVGLPRFFMLAIRSNLRSFLFCFTPHHLESKPEGVDHTRAPLEPEAPP